MDCVWNPGLTINSYVAGVVALPLGVSVSMSVRRVHAPPWPPAAIHTQPLLQGLASCLWMKLYLSPPGREFLETGTVFYHVYCKIET